jgi:hypothetical protein
MADVQVNVEEASSHKVHPVIKEYIQHFKPTFPHFFSFDGSFFYPNPADQNLFGLMRLQVQNTVYGTSAQVASVSFNMAIFGVTALG